MKKNNLINKEKLLLILIFTTAYSISFGQIFHGKIIEKGSINPIEYVNIGIPLKNIGTVSNSNGEFSIEIPKEFENDTIKFSCIGFTSFVIKISDLKENQTVSLERKTYSIDDIVVLANKTKIKTLGVNSNIKRIQAGFKDNTLGYECGILMRNNSLSNLQGMTINIANCTLDSIYYRLNIYKKVGNKQFENILKEPIYIETKAIPAGTLTFDLSEFNINIRGHFLVTLEHVKSQSGKMFFSTGIGKKTYYRKTSQGKWETAPIGVSFSVKVLVEK